jgi:hypothetical protein
LGHRWIGLLLGVQETLDEVLVLHQSGFEEVSGVTHGFVETVTQTTFMAALFECFSYQGKIGFHDLYLWSARDKRSRINIPMVAKTNSSGTTANFFTIGKDGGGSLRHGGLVPTPGTQIDQIATFNLSMTLSVAWQDTVINSTDLATGTYLVQVEVNNDGVGGGQTLEFYSGVMSWYGGDTDEGTSDEIVLHRAGEKNSSNAIFLRIQRTLTIDADDLKLQIASTNDDSGPSTVSFKFRRMI